MQLQQFFLQHQLILTIIVIWSLIWKGNALWKAACNNHKWWFIAILLINTIGILEIIYIFGFSKKSAAKINA
jgi:hypothetical protein